MNSTETSEEEDETTTITLQRKFVYETASTATLEWACTGQHLGITRYLIDVCHVNPDVSCDSDGITPLMLASSHGHTDIVTLLINRNSDVNRKDADGRTALHHAVRHNHVRVADILIRLGGARVDAADRTKGATSLSYAALHGNLAIARCLVEHGCSLDVQDDDGDTALHAACREEWDEVAVLLVGAGASVKLRNNLNATPVCVASNYLKRVLREWVDVDRNG